MSPHPFPQVGAAFPALCHLSLNRSLVSEVAPVLRRKRSYEDSDTEASDDSAFGGDAGPSSSTLLHAWPSRDAMRGGVTSASPDSVVAAAAEGYTAGPTLAAAVSTATQDASFGSWYEKRRAAQARSELRWAHPTSSDVPAHTSVKGWTALLRGLPRGLFSLDVRGCALSFPSYSLLREHVSELRATKVLSPEAAAAAELRRVIRRQEARLLTYEFRDPTRTWGLADGSSESSTESDGSSESDGLSDGSSE